MSTKEYRKNHTIAWNHFVEIGLIPENDQHSYVLHHIDVNLRHNDPKRYDEWRIEDLIPMTKSDHSSFHALGKHWKLSEETKEKMRKPKSELHKQHISENNAAHRQEVRDKIAKSHIGIKPDEKTREKLSQARKRNALKNFLNSREYAERETILKLYESGLSIRQIQFRYDKPTYVGRIIKDYLL